MVATGNIPLDDNAYTDTSTGEVTRTSRELVTERSSNLLEEYANKQQTDAYIQHYLLGKVTNKSPQQKMHMYAAYTGSEPADVGSFLNRTVAIIGATIMYHGPFTSMPDADGRSTDKNGYYYILMRTTKLVEVEVPVGNRIVKVKRPLVLKTSANQICDLMLGLIQVYGAYDWDAAEYVSFSGSKSAGYFATIISEEELKAASSQE